MTTSRPVFDARPARWSEAPAPDLDFPYMAWAHTHSARSACPLTNSGVPIADAAFLDVLGRMDLAHASRSALPELEAMIADRFGVDRDRVLVTLGASGALHATAMRWFRPGTRILADVPSYEPFRSLPLRFGAELVPYERRLEEAWRLDPERVTQLLARGSGPAHIFVANPHNPTGAMSTRDEVSALARAAERTGGLLLSCDVYMEFVPRAESAYAFELAPNALSMGTLTKAYGLGSLRIGWIVLGSGLAREKVHLQDMTYLTWVDAPTATLRAAKLAWERLPALLEPLRRIERENRPAWERWLRTTDGVEAFVPPHGIVAFPRIVGVSDTYALADFLALEHGVDVVPGEFFGLAGHVRVSCGGPREVVIEGLERLTRGIQAFRAQRS